MRPSRSCITAGMAVTASVCVLLLLVSCRSSPLVAPDAAFSIGDRVVKYADFEQYLDRSVGLETVLGSEVLSGLLDEFVDELLLEEVAAREGFGVSSSGWEAAQALIRERVREVSEDDVAAYYSAHQEEFVRPERVRMRQVLAADREAVEEVSRRLRQGASFEILMDEMTGEVSGREDELTRDDVPGAFADTIFSLSPGEVSQVVAVEYGFHLFQVLERLPAERVSVARASPDIIDRLIRARADRALVELVAEARDRYNVVIYERNLPFNYRGLYATDHNQSADQ